MLVDPLEITQEKSADGAAIEAVFKLRDRPPGHRDLDACECAVHIGDNQSHLFHYPQRPGKVFLPCIWVRKKRSEFCGRTHAKIAIVRGISS